MKTTLLFAAGLLAALPTFAADTNTNSTDQVKTAIAKIQAETNYSWVVKVELPAAGFTPDPMQGQTEKNGFTLITQNFNDNNVQAAFKAGKVAVNDQGQWELFDAANSQEFRVGAWLARSKTGADEAADLLSKVKELKAGDGGVLSGDATEAGATELLSFGRRSGAGGPPPPKNAKAAIKFWLKDGALTKFESHLTGSVAFGPDAEPQEMEIIRTVEFKDLGKTKFEVPPDAKKKLEGQ